MDIKLMNAVISDNNNNNNNKYYTECDNKECGHYYKLGYVGELCELCLCGKMQLMEETEKEE
jgi:hypothetical protein